MKAFVVFILALIARDTIATPIIAVGETGASAQFRSEDNVGNYNFGYNEDHTSGGTFRREAGDAHGNVAGSYGLRDADGRIRIVNYIANDDGFKADIQTNEPGVEPKDTADASFNKAASVLVETVAAPAPIVAVPHAEPVAYRTERVEVAAPLFPPVSAVPVAKTIAQPITYSFPEPAAVPVAKTIATPAVAVAEAAPLTYAFPAPAAVAKSSTTTITTEAKPVSYAFPAPAAIPVAKSPSTFITTETRPATYAFPAPAAVPVAKSATTTITTEAKPVTYAFPAPAAIPVAKSATTTFITEAKPISYAFPAPAAVPVAKSSTTTITTEAKPVAYSFPAPAAVPVAKSVAAPVAVAAPTYAFPAPAAIPVAKSSSLHYAAAPIATAPLAYAAAPTSKFSYATEVHAPAHYAVKTAEVKYAPAPVAYAPALRYTINPHLSAFRYATPYYKSLYSPVVASFAGPVPYFNNIEYHGFPVVKK